MKQCPRCASEITSKMKKCDRCGLPLDGIDFSDEEEKELVEAKNKKAAKKERKEAKKLAKKEKRERESVSDTDFSRFATNSDNPVQEEPVVQKKGLFGNKKKKNEVAKPKFELDENGEFNIDTDDVEIVGKEIGKIIDDQYTKNYSVKKARGDYRPPKVKWWEIYKLADRSFARRKIKKEVNKAAKIKPDFINKTKLLMLSIFLGWCGAQNFYAKNTKKGWLSVVSLICWLGIAFFAPYSTFLSRIQISIGGCAGFIVLLIWFGDIFNVLFNSFKYRIQKEGFIFAMNVETRAKLGEKYIDLDLYKKPWWVRTKVWFQKKRRDYEEWKHDRRQRMIEKEKARLAEREEQEKIDAEIARKEAMEDAELEKNKIVVDKQMISELESFGGEESSKDNDEENSDKNSKKKESKQKTTKAKFVSKTGAKKSGSKNSQKKK